MSNKNQKKFVVLTNNVSLAGGVNVVTLARPVTTNPAISNNKDHVIEPQTRDEFRAGKASVDFGTFGVPAVLVQEIALVRSFEDFAPNSPNFGGSDQGTNVIGADDAGPTPGALFPNGSVGVGDPLILFSDPTGLALGGQKLDDPSSNTPADTIQQLLRNIPIDANQEIRITVNNTGGALGPDSIQVVYDTGLHAGDYSLQS